MVPPIRIDAEDNLRARCVNHPDKLAEARGMCAACYQKAYHRGEIDATRRPYRKKARSVRLDEKIQHIGPFPRVRLHLRPEDVLGMAPTQW